MRLEARAGAMPRYTLHPADTLHIPRDHTADEWMALRRDGHSSAGSRSAERMPNTERSLVT